jgi:hypothetical protein
LAKSLEAKNNMKDILSGCKKKKEAKMPFSHSKILNSPIGTREILNQLSTTLHDPENNAPLAYIPTT